MARASMVSTLSALIVLSHVAASSASTWDAATCLDDPEVDLCDDGCPDDPEVDLCGPLVVACLDDPEVDLCDGHAPTEAPPTMGCPDDPEVDLCGPLVVACLDDPEVDLCDGHTPTEAPPTQVPNSAPTEAPPTMGCPDDPEVDLCDGPAPTQAPAPTFPAGTTSVIRQSMSFSSSGTSSQVANAVVEHLAAHMDVPKSACTVNVAEVTARRLTENVPAVAFLLPLGRRLSSSTQWKADYEIQLDDPQKANEVLAKANAISGDPSAFASSMASKFEELGLTMDVGSLTVQLPTIAAAEEPNAVVTTPPPSTVEEGDTQASTDALVIILVLALVAVIGCICAGFWLHHFRRSGYRRKEEDQRGDVQVPAADPESQANAKEEPVEDAARASGEQQADGNDGVVM